MASSLNGSEREKSKIDDESFKDILEKVAQIWYLLWIINWSSQNIIDDKVMSNQRAMVFGLFDSNFYNFFFDSWYFLSSVIHSFYLAFLMAVILSMTLAIAFKGRLLSLPVAEVPKLSWNYTFLRYSSIAIATKRTIIKTTTIKRVTRTAAPVLVMRSLTLWLTHVWQSLVKTTMSLNPQTYGWVLFV